MSTFNETYFEFDAEIDRLADRIEDLRAEVEELADDNPRKQQKIATIQQLESQRKGAVWARDVAHDDEDFPQWDESVDGVTLGALRAGPYASLQNDLESDPDAGIGSSGTLIVAQATVEAPYVTDDMSDRQRTLAVSQLHPFYRDWAEARIDELMDPEWAKGNGTS